MSMGDNTMINSIMQFMREEEGFTTLEYGLVAMLIGAAITGAVIALGMADLQYVLK